MLIWTGTDLLFVSVSEVLAGCSRNKKVYTPSEEEETTGMPHFIWRAYKELDHAMVTIYLFPESPACQRWMAARRLDTTTLTWEEALLKRLSELHPRLLTNSTLPAEKNIAYEDWGAMYDRIFPVE
jgi:hypothetical protein